VDFAGQPSDAAWAATPLGQRLHVALGSDEWSPAVAHELLLIGEDARRNRADLAVGAWAELAATRALMVTGQLELARSVLDRLSAWVQAKGFADVRWRCDLNSALWLHASGKTGEAIRAVLSLARSSRYHQLGPDAPARAYALTAYLLQWFEPGAPVVDSFALADRAWAAAGAEPPVAYRVLRAQSALDGVLWSSDALRGLLPATAGARTPLEPQLEHWTHHLHQLRCTIASMAGPAIRHRVELVVLECLHRALTTSDPTQAIGALFALHESGSSCHELAFETKYRTAGVLLMLNQARLAEGVLANLTLRSASQLPVPQQLLILHLQSRVALANGDFHEALSSYQRYASSSWRELAYITPGLREDLAFFQASARGLAPDRVDRTKPAFVDHALALVESDPCHASVAGLAKRVGISDRALRAAFVAHLRVTPKEFITRARLDAAHRSITSGECAEESIAELAARFGFTHPGRFSSLYRARFGHRPRHAATRSGVTQHVDLDETTEPTSSTSV
jgi:AraC-like DNA-binding protein